MYGTKTSYSQNDVDYYKRQAEDAEDTLRRERNRQEQEQQTRQRERQESMNERMRTASGWPDALRKQASLHQREIRYEDASDPNEDFYFSEAVKACNFAIPVYMKAMTDRQGEIDSLLERIEAIKAEVREETAKAIETQSNRSGWTQVAEALRQYDDDSVSEWLDW